jgi:hypothetical protein
MKQTLLLLICLCFVVLISAVPVWDNPAPVLRGDNIMWNRCAVSTNDGGVIYVWSDSHRGSRDIYAQKLDSDGNPVWNPPLLVAGSDWYETYPTITESSDGRYIVAFTEHRGYADNRVRVQKITSTGQLYWQSEGITVCEHGQDYYDYTIAADNTGGAIVFWKDYRNDHIGIYAQRVNGSGVIQWAVNGLPYGDYNGDTEEFAAVPDGAGGAFLQCSIRYSAQNSVYLKRIQANGNALWIQMLTSMPGYNFLSINLSRRMDDSVIATWNFLGVNSFIKAQRVNLSGNLVWSSPVTIIQGNSETPPFSSPTRHRIVSSGNNLVVVWEDDSSGKISAQKLDLNGNLLWNEGGMQICSVNSEQTNFRITTDNSGSVIITWLDDRELSFNSYSVYSQLITAAGTLIWPQEGVWVTTLQQQYANPLPRYSQNKVFLFWEDSVPGNWGLFCQMLTITGNPILPPGGSVVNQGIATYSKPDAVVPINGGVAVFWEDNRFLSEGNRIYVQYLNADGSAVFEANGIPVTPTPAGQQYNPTAAASPDGSVLVVWVENIDDAKEIRGQKFSPSGTRLWGDSGLIIAQNLVYYYGKPQISYYGDAFYIAYARLVYMEPPINSYYHRLFAQKVQGDQIVWDPAGVLISEYEPDNSRFDALPEAIVDDYFVWIRQDANPASFGQMVVYVKRINPDGSTAAGWPATGVALSDYLNWDTTQHDSKAVITPAGLAVVWSDYRIDFIQSLYGQLISPEGELLWDASGLEMQPSTNEQEDAKLVYNNGIVLIWRDMVGGNQNNSSILMQKFDLAGQALWGESGVAVYSFEGGFDSYYPEIALFPNGGMLAVYNLVNYNTYYEDRFLAYRYINPDGSMLSPALPFTDGYDDVNFLKLAVSGNEAYAIWQEADMYHSQDARCEDSYPPTYMINAQKFSSPVSIEEEGNIPAIGLVLEQNYPNPFNPFTSIGFTLKVSSESTLGIYNLRGQKVKTLHKGWLDKGRHTLVWDGMDDRGNPCSSGIYYYRLTASGESRTQKMLLLK